MAEELDALIEQARLALEAGDGETALDVLEAITDEVAGGGWPDLLPHDVPAVYEVLGELGDTFVEPILTADPTESERDEWERRLLEWDDRLRHFVGEPTLAAATDAAGWKGRAGRGGAERTESPSGPLSRAKRTW